jgi:signal transduction histidine kinase
MSAWLREGWLLDDGEVKPALSLAMLLSRASMGVLLLRDGANGAMRAVVSEGMNDDDALLFGNRISSLASIGRACARHRRVSIRDARSETSDGEGAIRELSRELGFRGMEIVPLERHGDAALGALTLLFRQPLRVTPRSQRPAALAIALIALALDNARLRTEAERRRRLAEQRAHDRLQFLARINHELRTPLQSITGYVDLLKSDAERPTERQRDMLDRIEHSEQVLLAIIDDVASLGKLEAGRMTYTLTAVSAADALTRVMSIVAPLAQRQKVHVRVGMPTPDVLAHADRVKLTQILINLVTNAIKFTPPGRDVLVRARQAEKRVEFIVRDEGPGIRPDKVATIFDPYVQIDRGEPSPLAGSGLGLAISREFAEGMGGGLVVESTPGHGSTFTLSIRAHRPDRPAWRSRVKPLIAAAPMQAPTGPIAS